MSINTWDQAGRVFKVVAIIFIVIVLIVMGFFFHTVYEAERFYAAKKDRKYDEYTCVEKWGRSGLASNYNPRGGCLVEIRTDVWVPETAVKFHK